MHELKISLFLILLAGAAWGVEPHPDAAATLVVYNTKEPHSIEIARYYAQQRGIPEKNLLGLSCPNQEEITRTEYNTTILRPIREYVQQKDFMFFDSIPKAGKTGTMITAVNSKLKYIVLCYGMPLKIAHDPTQPITDEFKGVRDDLRTNAAAVDSELACLPTPQQPISAFLNNPLYLKTFANARGWNDRVICVARLDGPTPMIAKRLIDESIKSETLGIYGRALFDSRGIKDSHSSYKLGDKWIENIAKKFNAESWEVYEDRDEATFNENIDSSNCVVYVGWYAHQVCGPFQSNDFHFRPGSIAYHLHSVSAHTLRSSTANWTGPLLARGATATLGCVYEPFLQMTPNMEILFDRLWEGCSFGEAAYSSQQFISWMTTVVGDPLYRPFSVPNNYRITTFEARFSSLDDEEKTALAWAYRLKSRQIFMAGDQDRAIELLQEQSEKLKNPVTWEGLANLYVLMDDKKRAAEAIKKAADAAKKQPQGSGILRSAARICAKARQWDASIEFYRTLLTQTSSLPDYYKLCEEAEKVDSETGSTSDARFFENLRHK
jgi:uncharacterized protein (TIGR03790 family)